MYSRARTPLGPQGPLECSKTKFGSGALLRARCHGPRHRRCCWFGYCPLGWAAALLRGWRLECSGGRNHCLWLLGAAAGASRSCSTASGLALRLLAQRRREQCEAKAAGRHRFWRYDINEYIYIYIINIIRIIINNNISI